MYVMDAVENYLEGNTYSMTDTIKILYVYSLSHIHICIYVRPEPNVHA